MNSNKKTLIICRDISSYYSLFRSNYINLLTGNSEVIIVSDDLDVHHKASFLKNTSIIYFDQLLSFYNVTNNVIVLLHQINNFLKLSSNNIIREYLLYWIHHVEGGETTQRIQDAFLELENCKILLEKEQPDQVVFGHSSKRYWEDDLLDIYIRNNNIKVIKLTTYFFKFNYQNIWQVTKPIAKEFYRICQIIQILLRKNKSKINNLNTEKIIAIQLCSNAQKHLNHTLPIIDEFKKKGIRAILFTFDLGNFSNVLRKQGYDVIELESYLSLKDLFYSWIGSMRSYISTRHNLTEFIKYSEQDSNNKFVSIILKNPILNYYIHELPSRYRLDVASTLFFKTHQPKIVRFWTDILPQGVIAYEAAFRLNVKPITFWHPTWPYNSEEPYKASHMKIDYYFCISKAHIEKLIIETNNSSNYILSGIAWFSILKKFKEQYNRVDSLKHLGVIRNNEELVIFLDAQAVLRGYCSSLEQTLLVSTLCNFTEKNVNTILLIKPHAQHKKGTLEKYFKEKISPRIVWLDISYSPYHCINASDLIITKYSTLVAEAMILNTPSICVILDKEPKWKIYENAVTYVYEITELENLLVNLLQKKYFSEWKEGLQNLIHNYKLKHLSQSDTDRNKIIAQTLCELV